MFIGNITNNCEELKERINETVVSIILKIIRNATHSLLRRAQSCKECDDRNFEHLL